VRLLDRTSKRRRAGDFRQASKDCWDTCHSVNNRADVEVDDEVARDINIRTRGLNQLLQVTSSRTRKERESPSKRREGKIIAIEERTTPVGPTKGPSLINKLDCELGSTTNEQDAASYHDTQPADIDRPDTDHVVDLE